MVGCVKDTFRNSGGMLLPPPRSRCVQKAALEPVLREAPSPERDRGRVEREGPGDLPIRPTHGGAQKNSRASANSRRRPPVGDPPTEPGPLFGGQRDPSRSAHADGIVEGLKRPSSDETVFRDFVHGRLAETRVRQLAAAAAGEAAQSMHQPWPWVTNASRRHSLQIGRRHLGQGPLIRRFTTTFEHEAHTDF